MKKILFSAVNLEMGGVEKALVMLINNLANRLDDNGKNKYKVTLVLEEKKGIFLSQLDSKVEVLEYRVNKNKNRLFRKFYNFILQRKFIIKTKNKFDFSCSFATYSKPGSFVARVSSKNAILWCHMDYLSFYNGDKAKVKEFFNNVKFRNFKKLVFVSKKSMDTFLEVYPQLKEKVIHINNMIDYERILRQSDEKIEIEKNEFTFINVSRHEENQKKITRILEASKLLEQENVKFKVLFIGDGPDSDKYKKIANELGINKNVVFIGRKKNPYPYIKFSDCMILTSDYEGSPVAFVEAFTLNKPIITTDVAGSEQIKGRFGIVTSKKVEDIANEMKYVIKNGYEIKEKFDAKKYNEEIIEKIEKLM